MNEAFDRLVLRIWKDAKNFGHPVSLKEAILVAEQMLTALKS